MSKHNQANSNRLFVRAMRHRPTHYHSGRPRVCPIVRAANLGSPSREFTSISEQRCCKFNVLVGETAFSLTLLNVSCYQQTVCFVVSKMRRLSRECACGPKGPSCETTNSRRAAKQHAHKNNIQYKTCRHFVSAMGCSREGKHHNLK
jgi:hypothetical protein